MKKRITQAIFGVIILIFMGVVFWQIIQMSSRDSDLAPCPDDVKTCSDGSWVTRSGPNCSFSECVNQDLITQFNVKLEEAIRIEIGHSIEDYNPPMLLQIFPGLRKTDFNGVGSTMGQYVFDGDQLYHVNDELEPVPGAVPRIAEAGFETLLHNVTERFLLQYPNGDIETMMVWLKDEEFGVLPQPPRPTEEPVACTMDAKVCPDGSYVGRVAPDCNFAECPVAEFLVWYGQDYSKQEEYRIDCEQRMGVFNGCWTDCRDEEKEDCLDVCSMVCKGPASEHMPSVPLDSTFCTPESKEVEMCTMDYTPVCGEVEVMCLTTPCDPIPQTFGNACGACASGNVTSYTEGECSDEVVETETSFGYITELSETRISIDQAEYLFGSEATAAAKEDGKCHGGSTCLPNGFYIRNLDSTSFELKTSNELKVYVNTDPNTCGIPDWSREVSYEQFRTSWSNSDCGFLNYLPYHFLIQEGVIVEITEQYIP